MSLSSQLRRRSRWEDHHLRPGTGKNSRPYPKETRAIKGWGHSSRVEHLPSNCEDRVQTPVLPKKKRKKEM
jgi:hypothetical protein